MAGTFPSGGLTLSAWIIWSLRPVVGPWVVASEWIVRIESSASQRSSSQINAS